jgi:hypothetical protein
MNILIDYKLSGLNTTQGPDKAACHAQVVTTTIHECGGAVSKFNHEWHEEEIFNRKEHSAAKPQPKQQALLHRRDTEFIARSIS